ncbi:hypothetical protein BH10BAC3_BH10BAC3_10470 [soil metagenome]
MICSGKSSRVEIDTSLVRYHQKKQSYHVYKTLQPFVEKVFLCCNHLQATSIQAPYLHLTDYDRYANINPIGALLSAYKAFPGKNFVVVGCDYPFLTPANMNIFVSNIVNKTQPVAFYNATVHLYEPLLSFYAATNENGIKKILQMEIIRSNIFCGDSRHIGSPILNLWK